MCQKTSQQNRTLTYPEISNTICKDFAGITRTLILEDADSRHRKIKSRTRISRLWAEPCTQFQIDGPGTMPRREGSITEAASIQIPECSTSKNTK